MVTLLLEVVALRFVAPLVSEGMSRVAGEVDVEGLDESEGVSIAILVLVVVVPELERECAVVRRGVQPEDLRATLREPLLLLVIIVFEMVVRVASKAWRRESREEGPDQEEKRAWLRLLNTSSIGPKSSPFPFPGTLTLFLVS